MLLKEYNGKKGERVKGAEREKEVQGRFKTSQYLNSLKGECVDGIILLLLNL